MRIGSAWFSLIQVVARSIRAARPPTKQPEEDLALDKGSEETYVGRAIQQAQKTKQGIKEVRV